MFCHSYIVITPTITGHIQFGVHNNELLIVFHDHFFCLGGYGLSQLSVRVSAVDKHWVDDNEYVQCGFRDMDGPGKGRSFTIECEGKPHGQYVSLVRTGGEDSGKLRFCEVVVMGYKITGKYILMKAGNMTVLVNIWI